MFAETRTFLLVVVKLVFASVNRKKSYNLSIPRVIENIFQTFIVQEKTENHKPRRRKKFYFIVSNNDINSILLCDGMPTFA